MFTKAILEAEGKDMNELDLANSLRALAHFQHLDYDCLEMLLKESIKQSGDMKLRSLAVVLNSFAELDVTNPTLLTITREILLRSIDYKGPGSEVQELLPIDCAQFMTAYCRAKMFQEFNLMEALESQFVSQIDRADGPTTVTMFCAHAAWADH